jgi:hypothetical protein
MRWIWDGNKVTFGEGSSYTLSPCRESEVTEFMSRVARIREIYATLSAARVSFAGGKATYQDSLQNLDNLIDQHEVSGRYCSQVCGEIDTFFTPAGLSEEFGDKEELMKFVLDALVHLEGATKQPAKEAVNDNA